MSYRPACEKPCNDCPFRRKAVAGWLGDNTPQSFIVEISLERPLPCHQSIDYTRSDWNLLWAAQTIGKICAGSLIMAANIAKSPRDRAFPRMPRDTTLVFASPAEFITYHEASDFRSWESADNHEIREDKPMPNKPASKPKLLKSAPKKTTVTSTRAEDDYVTIVREALDDETGRELSQASYKDALEEIKADVDTRLAAVKEEIGED